MARNGKRQRRAKLGQRRRAETPRVRAPADEFPTPQAQAKAANNDLSFLSDPAFSHLNEIIDPYNGQVYKKIGLEEKVTLRGDDRFLVVPNKRGDSYVETTRDKVDTIETMTGKKIRREDYHPAHINRSFLGQSPEGRALYAGHDIISRDIERLLRNGKMLQRHHFLDVLATSYKADEALNANIDTKTVPAIANLSEWFNFGHLDDLDIAREGYNAISLVGTGMLNLPYASCIFTHSYIDRTLKIFVQAFYIVMEGQEGTADAGIQPGQFAIMEFRIADRPEALAFDPRIALVTDFKRYPEEGNKYRMKVLSNPQRLDGDALQAECESACNPVALMILALNTKNQPMERVEPSLKLNKTRIKQGKPPLLHYTRVYLHQYLEAARETSRMEATGTHASPRPHLRRGHYRYKNHPTIKPVWIDQCIVNAHMGDPIFRDGYVVRR